MACTLCRCIFMAIFSTQRLEPEQTHGARPDLQMRAAIYILTTPVHWVPVAAQVSPAWFHSFSTCRSMSTTAPNTGTEHKNIYLSPLSTPLKARKKSYCFIPQSKETRIEAPKEVILLKNITYLKKSNLLWHLPKGQARCFSIWNHFSFPIFLHFYWKISVEIKYKKSPARPE